ncbi:MAG: hypothetical protein NTY48_01580 [Candidatus Diapherotrites archaeon]|nr:hypothetical protein [Candidatus Diapherotrites archaeon]
MIFGFFFGNTLLETKFYMFQSKLSWHEKKVGYFVFRHQCERTIPPNEAMLHWTRKTKKGFAWSLQRDPSKS